MRIILLQTMASALNCMERSLELQGTARSDGKSPCVQKPLEWRFSRTILICRRKDGARAVDLDTMLAESDMVSIHLPVIDATKGIVNKDWFSKMKPTAILINTARAAVIDQKDFVEALQNGEIAGAAIDVYWKEPVPANHPLLSMRNVVCTPHMAGLTTDVDNWSGEMMAQEVLAYLRGEERKYIWKR